MLLQKLALELDLFEILPWLPITLRTEVRLVRVMHTALYDHLLLPVHLDFPQSFFTPGATILSNKVKVCDNVSFRCSCNWWSILHLASFSFLKLGQREFPGGQVVKDLVLSLLWFGFEFWSRDLICVLQAWLKEKKKKTEVDYTSIWRGCWQGQLGNDFLMVGWTLLQGAVSCIHNELHCPYFVCFLWQHRSNWKTAIFL